MSVDLTGHWTGRYDYQIKGTPVAFEVFLTDRGGILSGRISEPNTFEPGAEGRLASILDGQRTGTELRFVKVYESVTQDGDPVYEGFVNAAMTRIDGEWWFPHQQWWRGRFMMVRTTHLRAAREQAAKESVAITR